VTQSLNVPGFLTSLILLLALATPALSQRKSDVEAIPFSSAPYRVGERLTYNISFSNIISAAHVQIHVVNRSSFFGREGIEIRGHVQTVGMVNAALYALNNDYVSYVDPATGLPYRTQQVLREPLRTSNTSNDINQPVGAAAIGSKGVVEPGGKYDFLSALYRFRAMPLSGGSYWLTVQGDGVDYEIELKVTGQTSIKTNVGSFDTIVCQVKAKNNSQLNDRNIRVYFTNDERHVPVLITAKHKSAEIRAELAAAEMVTPPPPTHSGPPIGDGAAVQPPVVPPRATNGSSLAGLPFKVGEQLNYQIFISNIAAPAGTATYQVRARSKYFDREGLLLSVQAQTTNAIQRLFFANDQINSYVDPKTLLPFRTELKLVEGRRRVNQTLTVNQDYGTATGDKGEKIEIPIGTHDLLSIFYALRTLNLTPTRTTTPSKASAVSILVNNKPKTLFITPLKKENLQLGSQTIPAIFISLTTDDPQNDKFVLRVWVSDDQRRLPLRITASTEIGQLRADLVVIPVTPQ
jgi:hypothetical protein